jgi:fatty-acyl-CoA synthase
VLSTMQDGELSVGRLVRYGASVHAQSTVRTWTGEGVHVATFGELGAGAARLAHGLRELGVSGDQRVATYQWNNSEHLQAYLAVPAMGAVLHTLNIRMSAGQTAYIADHAQDHVVIVDDDLAPALAKALPGMTSVRHVIVNGDPDRLEAPKGVDVHRYEDLVGTQSAAFDWPTVDERSAAAVCYTSGTTGDPKGVAYSHRSVWLHTMQTCMSTGMRISPSDVALPIVPMFHAMAWGIPYAAMMVGASLVLPDRFLQPGHLARILASQRPTFAAAVPTIWQELLGHLQRHPQDLSHVREFLSGGAPCPPALMRAYHEQLGIDLIGSWGMTEMSPLGTIARPPSGVSEEQAWTYRATQGRFPAAVSARLVDESGNEVAWDDESVGELQVAGPWVTGHYHSPQQPVSPDSFDAGWLRTGDVGRISPDGYLTLTDRAKDVIKSGGEWISSVEIENAVMEHPSVAQAAVIGVPDTKWQERPLVAVVARTGSRVTPQELREHLARSLARWQLPENWCFVSEIPKTSVGKFDKKRLRGMYAEDLLDVETTT